MAENEINHLIAESNRGNEIAFRKLIDQYRQMVFVLAFRMLTDEEEAKDTVQETFIRLWQNLEKFDPEKKFSTWVCQITVNLCKDKLKSAKYRHMKEHVDLAAFNILNKVSGDNPEKSYINQELGAMIRMLTAKLSPKQKIVFTLSELEGLQSTDIAEITGLSQEKIKSNLYLARKEVKRQIENFWKD